MNVKTSISKSSLVETEVEAGVITVPRVREPVLKRPLDIMLSSFMLIVSLPVSLPIALAIKMEDGGSILYRQERWGRNGSHFRAYKFRTMAGNSDQDFGIKQAKENDPRISRPGLTGLATVYLPKDVPPQRKFRYDLLYLPANAFLSRIL